MGQVVVVENVTLDGVMQAPGGAHEDARGGFPYGGWAHPYADPVMAEVMSKGMHGDGALLFGRRTYQQFHGFWSAQTGNPFAEVLNAKTKYVASRTLAEPLPWQHSSLLRGDAVETVTELQGRVDGDLVVLGSGELVRTLAAAHLVDMYVLSIYPLTLGTGGKLFATGPGGYGTLELVEAVPTTTGVIVATYRTVAREDVVA